MIKTYKKHPILIMGLALLNFGHIPLKSALSWFPCIFRPTADGIDLKLGGSIYCGTPQAHLTVVILS